MARWIVVSFLRGEHPDAGKAMDAARIIYGDDVLVVQSAVSWGISQEEYRTRKRDRKRREPEGEDDGE